MAGVEPASRWPKKSSTTRLVDCRLTTYIMKESTPMTYVLAKSFMSNGIGLRFVPFQSRCITPTLVIRSVRVLMAVCVYYAAAKAKLGTNAFASALSLLPNAVAFDNWLLEGTRRGSHPRRAFDPVDAPIDARHPHYRLSRWRISFSMERFFRSSRFS